MGRLGKAVIEHPEIIDVIEGLVGADDEPEAVIVPQQPQALAVRERGSRRGRPPAAETYDTADAETLRSFVGTAAASGGTKAEMIDKILGSLGALNPSVVQSEFAKAGITIGLSLIRRQLGLWRKRRKQSAS